MSINYINQVFADEDIKRPIELSVMLVLADFANEKGVSWPSIKTICTRSRMSRSGVFRVLKSLKSKGKILIQSGQKQRRNSYYVITAVSYKAKLKNPLWLRRRRQILKLYEYECWLCHSHKDLQVHHVYYIAGKEPWDYPDSALMVLCDSCHAKEHGK